MREADQRPSHEVDQGSIYLDWVKALTGAPDTSEEEVQARVAQDRPRVEKLRDPFTPIARGDEAAREKEKVLWEDGQVLVISDTFAGGAKALVVPARPCLFPVDLTVAERKRVEVVTRAVTRAFLEVTGKEARAWVNVPSALSVRQLHVHVQPNHGDKSAEDAVAAWLNEHLATQQPEEVEFKLALDEEGDLERIADAAGGERSQTVTQTNTFFDTQPPSDTGSGALDKERYVARLRVTQHAQGHDYSMTLKGPEKHDESGQLTRKSESQWVLYEALALEMLAGKLDPIQGQPPLESPLLDEVQALRGKKALKPIGAFVNERTKVKTTYAGLPMVLELDKTTFPGDVVQCELELEVPGDRVEEYRAALDDLVSKAGVKTHKAKSKAARFFKALRDEKSR